MSNNSYYPAQPGVSFQNAVPQQPAFTTVSLPANARPLPPPPLAHPRLIRASELPLSPSAVRRYIERISSFVESAERIAEDHPHTIQAVFDEAHQFCHLAVRLSLSLLKLFC